MLDRLKNISQVLGFALPLVYFLCYASIVAFHRHLWIIIAFQCVSTDIRLSKPYKWFFGVKDFKKSLFRKFDNCSGWLFGENLVEIH